MKKNITAGIDFGNQQSIMSIPAEHGIDIVLNESSNRKTPTIVVYQEGRRLAGEFAQQQQMMNISNTITQLKRLVDIKSNLQENEQIIKNEFPFKLSSLYDGSLGIMLSNGEVLAIEQVIGFYLKSLVEIIQKKNPKIEQIVLAVPSNWTENQRRTILNSAAISKVKIAELLDSATASAVTLAKIHCDRFPEEREKGLNILFIEIGDSSMNASIAKLSKKTIEMKSNITDNTLGGQYFNDVLEKYLIEKVTKQYKIDPRKNERAIIRFKQACEKAKKTLSSNPVVLFEIPSLMNDIDVTFPLKREEFNELIKTFLPKIKSSIELAIEKSGIAKEDISYVEIVGGSSRIPILKESIKEIVGKVPKMSLDLDECFAIGAGHLSSQIDGNDIGIEIVNKNICPYSIDVQLTDHETETLNIFNEEETKLPSSFKFSFPASKTKTLKFYCNKSEIGKLEILNENQKESEIEVTVSIDSFGIIKIENVSNSTFSYKPKMTFSEQEIRKYQNLEEIQDKQDKLEIEIDNSKNELESLIFSTESEINSHNFDEETKKKIHSIHRWFDENEFERLSLNEYKSKIHEIKMITNDNMKITLDGIRQSLQEALDDIQKDAERAKLSESVSLLNEISKKIELVDQFLDSPKEKLLQKDIGGLLEEAECISNKVENLKKMPVTVKKHVKRRRRMNRRNERGQRFDQWSPFGVRNNFFGGFLGNPWQNDEYEYEYCYDDDDTEFEKQEQERKRKILQEQERKRQEILQKQEQERKRQEILQKQEQERKRQEILMEQERKKQIGRGRMRRSKVNNYSSEEDDFSYLSRVKKEAQKDEEMQVRREQEKQHQIEIENRRRAQIEQERVRRAKEAEMQRRAASNPWSSTTHSPYGRGFNPLYQSAQPRQQQRRVMPGYGYPWGF